MGLVLIGGDCTERIEQGVRMMIFAFCVLHKRFSPRALLILLVQAKCIGQERWHKIGSLGLGSGV
jgi:hypothetical protein